MYTSIYLWMFSSDKNPCVVLAKYRMNMEHERVYLILLFSYLNHANELLEEEEEDKHVLYFGNLALRICSDSHARLWLPFLSFCIREEEEEEEEDEG